MLRRCGIDGLGARNMEIRLPVNGLGNNKTCSRNSKGRSWTFSWARVEFNWIYFVVLETIKEGLLLFAVWMQRELLKCNNMY